MPEQMPLAQAFQIRPNRFRLLDKGLKRIGWAGSGIKLLEPGCSVGDASHHMSAEMGFDVTGFDLSQDLIEEAVRVHGNGTGLRFDVADAANLQYADQTFDGLYCEAAFSPMPDKRGVLKEYHRVLRPGSLVLINDFVIRNQAEDDIREEVIHIPCFAGVQTRECYHELFEQAGFELEGYYEEYGELIGLTAWLCKVYKVRPDEIGSYLSRYFHSGATGGACCIDAEADESGPDDDKGTFFKRSDLSFCQMIFRRS
jgi:ubiquinone/menaquinone biosynthesis C-methylase UbiE